MKINSVPSWEVAELASFTCSASGRVAAEPTGIDGIVSVPLRFGISDICHSVRDERRPLTSECWVLWLLPNSWKSFSSTAKSGSPFLSPSTETVNVSESPTLTTLRSMEASGGLCANDKAHCSNAITNKRKPFDLMRSPCRLLRFLGTCALPLPVLVQKFALQQPGGVVGNLLQPALGSALLRLLCGAGFVAVPRLRGRC